MTKSLDMYPNIIFFEDLFNEVKMENEVNINYTDLCVLDMAFFCKETPDEYEAD